MAAPIVGTDRAIGVANATSMEKYVPFKYDANTVTQAVFIAPHRVRVTAIWGRTRVAGSGGACTFAFYNCADGIAAASGTLLHSGTFDLTGTADTNQYLTLAPTGLVIEPGSSVNIVLTGTPTSAVGTITVVVEPTF